MVYALSQWLQLVTIARLGSVQAVGQFAFALALSAPIFMFCNLRLRFLIATSTSNEPSLLDYAYTRLATTVAAAAITAGAAMLWVEGAVLEVVVLVTGIKAIEALSDLCHGIFQKRERIDCLATSQFLAATALLVACYVGMAHLGGLRAALGVMLLARIGTFVAYDFPRAASMRLEIDFNAIDRQALGRWRMIFATGFPLGIVALLVSLNTNIPRYFIDSILGEYELGIYAALAYIPVAGYLIAGAFGQAGMQRVASALQCGELAKLGRLVGGLCAIGALMGLAGTALAILWARPILTLLYGAEFGEYSAILVALMIAATISYVVVQLVYLLTAARSTKVQVRIYLVDACLVALACWILVPRMGLYGAALASVLSQVVQLVIVALVVRNVILSLPDRQQARGRP